MRICQLCEPLKAGVGRHVVDLTRVLAERGHAVHLIYSPVRTDGYLLDELADVTGVGIHAVAMPRNPSPGDIRALAAIAGILLRDGPFDIIHGHSSKAGVYARILAA